jgi:spore coat protein H
MFHKILGGLLIFALAVSLFSLKGNFVAAKNDSATFKISNITPALNEPVTFDATGCPVSKSENRVSYNWNFGDSTSAAGIIVTHAFTKSEDFKVTLTITNNTASTHKLTQRVFVGRPEGWTEATHSKNAKADYDLLFSEDKVNRIDIIIRAADYQTMEENLATLHMGSEKDPVYVPATIKYNNYTWQHVGVRYKGNSSLFSINPRPMPFPSGMPFPSDHPFPSDMPFPSGRPFPSHWPFPSDHPFPSDRPFPSNRPFPTERHKYPFRLNFDKYEDTYPEIRDQRFYGFKDILLNNNWFDSSYIRDVVCSDIFRAGGIPTARGSFCRIYVDTGAGPVYWGLYSMFEDPSDQMLKAQFSDSDGNMYKGKQRGADWTSFSQSGFNKKTNKEVNDWSDLQAAITALNASRSDAAAWRTGLEAVFNVKLFLRWLAINTAIVNADTYGRVTANYYLYQDLTDKGRLIFIPWDFGLSLSMKNIVSRDIPSLSLSEVSNRWPLIRYLMDDPVYQKIYQTEMRTALQGCFYETAVAAKIRKLHALIRPYVVGAEGETTTYSYLTNGATEFDSALDELLNHISSRQTACQAYLGLISASPVTTATPTTTATKTPSRTAAPAATL